MLSAGGGGAGVVGTARESTTGRRAGGRVRDALPVNPTALATRAPRGYFTSFRNVRVSRMIPMTTHTNTAPKRKTPKTSRLRYSAGMAK